jgi:hypothetical protein
MELFRGEARTSVAARSELQHKAGRMLSNRCGSLALGWREKIVFGAEALH